MPPSEQPFFPPTLLNCSAENLTRKKFYEYYNSYGSNIGNCSHGSPGSIHPVQEQQKFLFVSGICGRIVCDKFLHVRSMERCNDEFFRYNPSRITAAQKNSKIRNNLSEITPVINRLWQIQSTNSLTAVNCISLTTENQNYEKFRLQQFLYSCGLNQMISQNYHQRTFGSSRFRQKFYKKFASSMG